MANDETIKPVMCLNTTTNLTEPCKNKTKEVDKNSFRYIMTKYGNDTKFEETDLFEKYLLGNMVRQLLIYSFSQTISLLKR